MILGTYRWISIDAGFVVGSGTVPIVVIGLAIFRPAAVRSICVTF